jgi:hypothetical protein
MPDGPDLRLYDANVPYHDRTPELRATRAVVVKFVNCVGTHLICPRRGCKRVRSCADRDPRALPFCWEQYRGMLRFLLCVLAKKQGIGGPGPLGQAEEEGGDEVRLPEPFRGQSLLAALGAEGADLACLARSAEDGSDDFTWEAMPEMRALFDRLTR